MRRELPSEEWWKIGGKVEQDQMVDGLKSGRRFNLVSLAIGRYLEFISRNVI